MAISYPHTIDNGAGERITFLRRVPGKLGDRIEVENVVGPGTGPPMHIHHYQDEALTVVQGRIGVLSRRTLRLDEAERRPSRPVRGSLADPSLSQ